MVQRVSVQQQTVEHGHVRGFVSGQVYDSIRYPKILRITVGACADSVYQALSPPLKGPGDEATTDLCG